MADITNGYCTQGDVESRVGPDAASGLPGFADEIVYAINAASRAVDGLCGQVFYQITSTDKYVAPHRCYVDARRNLHVARLPMPARTISAVYTDDGDTGSWTATTYYQAEPYGGEADGLSGLPYYTLVGTDGQGWRRSGVRPSVKVTATWGWAAVPDPVVQATILLAKDEFLRRKQGVGDVAGLGEFGAVRARENSHAMELLRPYARVGGRLLGGVA